MRATQVPEPALALPEEIETQGPEEKDGEELGARPISEFFIQPSLLSASAVSVATEKVEADPAALPTVHSSEPVPSIPQSLRLFTTRPLTRSPASSTALQLPYKNAIPTDMSAVTSVSSAVESGAPVLMIATPKRRRSPRQRGFPSTVSGRL